MEAFVYCWTDRLLNRFYIGSHKGTEDDGYVSSSKYMQEEYVRRPNDFSRQIITRGAHIDIIKLEHVLLSALNAANDPQYYNRHNGFGTILSDVAREKLSKSAARRWAQLSPEKQRAWIEMGRIGSSKPKTEAHKKAMRGLRPHVVQSGKYNNNAKRISTPFGIYGSLRDCANDLNIKYDSVMWKLNSDKYPEWSRL